MLPSENEMPTGSSKLEIQVSRRFDFALLVGSFVHVSSLPPQALNHVGHRFSNRRNFRLVCVEVGGDALRNRMPTGSRKLETQVSRRFAFALWVCSFLHASSVPPKR